MELFESLKISRLRNEFNLIINGKKLEINMTLYFKSLKIVKKNLIVALTMENSLYLSDDDCLAQPVIVSK